LSDIRSVYHYDLLPEAVNVAGTILAVRLHPEVEHGDPGARPLRTLGLLLTALGAVGAALAAVDAHFFARRPRGERAPPLSACPSGAAAASFLVPGLGQWLLGRPRKGLLLFGALTGLYLLGLLLSDFACVDRDRHFYYWAGQLLNGGATIVATLAFTSVRVREFLPHLDAGVLFTTASGLLNVLVMIDAASAAEAKLAPPGTA
jgi:TM2 domain-containing membrane protein YozV